MKQPITLIIACSDQAEHLARCVASSAGFANEILIADLGCDPDAFDLVPHQDHVCVLPHADAPAIDLLNWALSQATNEWILFVDSNDRLHSNLRDEIELELSRGAGYNGYRIQRTNHVLGRQLKRLNGRDDCVVRLFRRSVAEFESQNGTAAVSIAGQPIGSLPIALHCDPEWRFGRLHNEAIARAEAMAHSRFTAGGGVSALAMLTRPATAFASEYLLKSSWRDGMLGIQTAWLAAFEAFSAAAILQTLCRESELANQQPAAPTNHPKPIYRNAA